MCINRFKNTGSNNLFLSFFQPPKLISTDEKRPSNQDTRPLPPVPSSPIADTPPEELPVDRKPEQPKENEQKQEETPVDVPTITERRPTMETPAAVADDNIEEYAQPHKHDSNKLDVDTTDLATKRRTNTFSNLPSATEKRSSGSPLQRRNTDSSRPARKDISPENDVVYQHTTSVVKSVIEFNTGVQHAQPEEFVDLVKVLFSLPFISIKTVNL